MTLKGINKANMPESIKEKLKEKGKQKYTMNELKQILDVKNKKHVKKHIDELRERNEMEQKFDPHDSKMKYILA